MQQKKKRKSCIRAQDRSKPKLEKLENSNPKSCLLALWKKKQWESIESRKSWFKQNEIYLFFIFGSLFHCSSHWALGPKSLYPFT